MNIKTIALFLPTVVALFAAGFFYLQWQKAQQGAVTDQIEHQEQLEEAQALVEEVGRVVVLPEGELPTVSTIKDTSALTENQEFFQDAQEGDKVLVYQQARKAFLYRPSTERLINLAPINVAGTTQTNPRPDIPTANLEELDQAATVVLLNGTSTVGVTDSFASLIAEVFPGITVADRANAIRQDYLRSIIIPVNASKQALAQQVAERLGLVIGELPAGEVLPSADILVILGSDQIQR